MVGQTIMIFEQSQFNQMIDIIEIKNKISITAMYVDQFLTISLNKNDQDLSKLLRYFNQTLINLVHLYIIKSFSRNLSTVIDLWVFEN